MTSEEYNYGELKRIAKDSGRSVNDMLALSPKNDPFYVGSDGQVALARWFSAIYAKMGRPRECHIRRVHYWLVSQEPKYAKPDGKQYMNTEKDWDMLTIAAKYARYLELVPVENMVDRRNPEPHVYALNWEHTLPSDDKEGIDAEDIIESVSRKFMCANPARTQPVMMELWCEKSTMNDVLEPLARKFGMNLVTGLGELSITAVYSLIKRVRDASKPVRIFYISDFDPAGECMPVSVARKIEFFLRGQDESENHDVKLRQVMLTEEQCKKYRLPRTPIKDSEGRKEGFEDRHGTGATELDALEAVRPGELTKVITSIVMPYFDVDAWNDAVKLNESIREHVADFLKDKIGDVLKTCDLEEFDEEVKDLPGYDDEPVEMDGDADEDAEWILDSELDYEGQLAEYKKFQGKD